MLPVMSNQPLVGGGDKDDDDDDNDEPVEGETIHACYMLHNTCVCIKCLLEDDPVSDRVACLIVVIGSHCLGST